MANIIGPAIGAAIEKKKGKSPVKGALLGSLTQSAVRGATKLAATVIAGYILKKLFEKSTSAPEEGIDAAGSAPQAAAPARPTPKMRTAR